MMCRICFGDQSDGELVAPCACSGDQRFVHLDCLLRWQRMALVNQPTHPSTYDKHTLHRRCGICQQEFTTKPPSRHELMASFTGAELAAMISPGYLLATDEAVSHQLERQRDEFLAGRDQIATPYDHWIRSAYLITAVHEDDGMERLLFSSEAAKQELSQLLSGVAYLDLKDRRLKVDSWEKDHMCLKPLDFTENCGNDHVVAVNTVRPLDGPPKPAVVHEVLTRLRKRCPGCLQVEVFHYQGGPCAASSIMACLVPGGSMGWTCLRSLEEALELAQRLHQWLCSTRGQEQAIQRLAVSPVVR